MVLNVEKSILVYKNMYSLKYEYINLTSNALLSSKQPVLFNIIIHSKASILSNFMNNANFLVQNI